MTSEEGAQPTDATVPIWSERDGPEPDRADPEGPEPDRAEPDRAEPDRAEPDRAEPDQPDRADPRDRRDGGAGDPTEPGTGATAPVGRSGADGGADRRPFPSPSDPGFSDAALLAGRPFSSYLHIGALVLAAGADLGAFYEIIALTLGDTYDFFVILVLVGFTATVIYLAHVVGVLLRNWRARERSTSPLVAVPVLLVLAGLGAVAFYVRLHVQPSAPATAGGGFSSVDPGSAATAEVDPQRMLLTALLFLGFYVATIVVAMVGAYLTHNPLRESYALAVRAHRTWSAKAASSQAAFLDAQGRAAGERAGVEAAKKIHEAGNRRKLALAEELKNLARLRILAAARDAAQTDAWTQGGDKRPYTFTDHGPTTNGSGG